MFKITNNQLPLETLATDEHEELVILTLCRTCELLIKTKLICLSKFHILY